MDTLTAIDVVRVLKDVPLESILFVSYLAGRQPTPQAIKEAQRSSFEGIASRHYTGALKALTTTQKGETVVTLWVEERDSPRGSGGLQRGAYRAFNPSLGRMLVLEVLELAPVAPKQ